ncbi:hypothetical protein Q0Z83_022830 [Actinoplanes sichuanensis]|uniref:Uncharacterized protein n=1 Tax=Actinoplanes sichuanensis TaxID=512349 RepID=A0ABW4A0Z3_9ACTN|nr:hypothetical protein [Actinoplanes sichuanensis]BEL04092.1 hypothetical protein Q0Z83_022830 [Actinoplanes sichuanensis]
MTSTPALWTRHPGVRAGRRSRATDHAANLLLGVIIAGGVGVLVFFRHSGAATMAVLALSVLAVLESAMVLTALRRADRIAAEVALHQLGAERGAAALARDLRDELARLHQEVARLAAQTAIAAQPRPHDVIR